eukprot:Rhum_TRINITY_DN8040_c0_g1::Rhum_TRINITY_DN8040_c0_g1_i1::g.25889::m.25889/K11088/SNRPD3, SMD3; small nuclear ribonucleoprotein D3
MLRSIKKSSMPIRLLMEAKGTMVALEATDGTVYRGLCADIQETLNVRLTNVTIMKKNGKTCALEQAFIRGSCVRFIVLNDGLRTRYEEELKKVVEKKEVRDREKGTGPSGAKRKA